LIGVSYETVNIILFVVIHPLLTLALLVWLVAALRENRACVAVLPRLSAEARAGRSTAARSVGRREAGKAGAEWPIDRP
jgi:hypothetical protein